MDCESFVRSKPRYSLPTTRLIVVTPQSSAIMFALFFYSEMLMKAVYWTVDNFARVMNMFNNMKMFCLLFEDQKLLFY